MRTFVGATKFCLKREPGHASTLARDVIHQTFITFSRVLHDLRVVWAQDQTILGTGGPKVTRFLAVTLGTLLATLTLAGVGQAQEVATIQGTLQSVDCNTKALVIKTADGSEYRMYVLPPASTSIFVNSNPVGFCTLQQYVGSNVTVSVLPNGNQLVVKRVDVQTTATPSSTQNQPSGQLINGMPGWAKIALGVAIVGALIYFGTQRHDPPSASQPYYQCRDGSWGQSCPPPPQSQPYYYQCRDGSWRQYCP
jgi:hypothetical protein